MSDEQTENEEKCIFTDILLVYLCHI